MTLAIKVYDKYADELEQECHLGHSMKSYIKDSTVFKEYKECGGMVFDMLDDDFSVGLACRHHAALLNIIFNRNEGPANVSSILRGIFQTKGPVIVQPQYLHDIRKMLLQGLYGEFDGTPLRVVYDNFGGAIDTMRFYLLRHGNREMRKFAATMESWTEELGEMLDEVFSESGEEYWRG
jgi:hypothetical protein